MDIDKLIERLRTESLYKDKATLEIMDLCMEAAYAISKLQAENTQLLAELERVAQKYETAVKLQVKMTEISNRQRAELEQAKRERNVAYKLLGGEPPKTCKTCVLWGGNGWGQYQIGYCEGDDNPHGPNDFCSRHRGPQKEG